MSSGYLLLKLRKAMLLLSSYEPEVKELDFWNISDYPAFFYSITLRFKSIGKEFKDDFVFPAKKVILLRKAFLGNQPLFGKNHASLGRHVTNQSVSLTLAKDLACCLISTQNMLAVKCQVRKKRSKQVVMTYKDQSGMFHAIYRVSPNSPSPSIHMKLTLSISTL